MRTQFKVSFNVSLKSKFSFYFCSINSNYANSEALLKFFESVACIVAYYNMPVYVGLAESLLGQRCLS